MKQIGIIEAEERFILQRQLDNHLKINSKELLKSFGDIYNEFESIINGGVKIIKKQPRKMNKETAQQLWRMSLAKLKGG